MCRELEPEPKNMIEVMIRWFDTRSREGAQQLDIDNILD